MSYQHLGDAQLTYVADMAPVVDPTTVPGQLLGNGTGTIQGPGLNGVLRWSFFEEDCAWDPGMLQQGRRESSDPGRSVCRTYPRGVIETEDGALLQFEGQGFALRRDNDPVWIVGSTVRFVTDAEQYSWLSDVLAIYEAPSRSAPGPPPGRSTHLQTPGSGLVPSWAVLPIVPQSTRIQKGEI